MASQRTMFRVKRSSSAAGVALVGVFMASTMLSMLGVSMIRKDTPLEEPLFRAAASSVDRANKTVVAETAIPPEMTRKGVTGIPARADEDAKWSRPMSVAASVTADRPEQRELALSWLQSATSREVARKPVPVPAPKPIASRERVPVPALKDLRADTRFAADFERDATEQRKHLMWPEEQAYPGSEALASGLSAHEPKEEIRHGASADEPREYAMANPLPADELQELRGGFRAGGLEFSFAVVPSDVEGAAGPIATLSPLPRNGLRSSGQAEALPRTISMHFGDVKADLTRVGESFVVLFESNDMAATSFTGSGTLPAGRNTSVAEGKLALFVSNFREFLDKPAGERLTRLTGDRSALELGRAR